MIFQKKAERPLNTTSILNNLKSFIKKVYQKEWRQNVNKKKEQNNYFRAGIIQKVEKVLLLRTSITLLQNTKNVIIYKSYIFFIASNQQNIMTTREKN